MNHSIFFLSFTNFSVALQFHLHHVKNVYCFKCENYIIVVVENKSKTLSLLAKITSDKIKDACQAYGKYSYVLLTF